MSQVEQYLKILDITNGRIGNARLRHIDKEFKNAILNDTKAVDMLLTMGANPFIHDDFGNTPLMVAACAHSPRALATLIKLYDNEEEINAVNLMGNSALSLAKLTGNERAIHAIEQRLSEIERVAIDNVIAKTSIKQQRGARL